MKEALDRLAKAASISGLLDGAVAAYGGAIAFEHFGNSLSFSEFGLNADALAAYLQTEMGVTKGTKVALMSPNCLASPVATQAILKCGGVQVSVNPLYTPDELKHQLNDSEAEILLIFSGSIGSFQPIREETGISQVMVIGLGDCGQTDLPSPPVPDGFGDYVTLAEALATGAGLTFSPVSIGRDDMAFLQYTGGTTGPSKGAVLTHGNILSNLDQFFDRLSAVTVERGEVIVTALPLYHIFALVGNFLCYTSIGGKNILITNPRDMDGFIATIKSAGFTRLNGVNTLLAGMMLHPDFGAVDFSRLKLTLSGGTACMEAVSDQWKSFTGKPIIEAYGLSETSPALTISDPLLTEFTGAIGGAVKDTDIRLLDDDGNVVARGERGELVCKGPQVFSGYYKKPEANKTAFTEDGFFRTGDIAIEDEDGCYRIVDRKKDMVIVSGFNVYPTDIEQVATRAPGVQECACIGVPDDKTGEALRLYVVKAAGADPSPDEIIAFCRDYLTGYKVPKQIEFIPEVPKSAVGKVLRRELRSA